MNSGSSLAFNVSSHNKAADSLNLDDLLEKYMASNGQDSDNLSTTDGSTGLPWWKFKATHNLEKKWIKTEGANEKARYSLHQKYNVGYRDKALRFPENKLWRAAGNLVYHLRKDGELLVLLGKPDHSDDSRNREVNHRNTWNLLGGKREVQDLTAVDTACREMLEESSGLLSADDLMGEPNNVIWYPHGKYAVFLRQVEGQEDLPTKFAALKRKKWRRSSGLPRPTLDLAWVALTDIMEPAASMRKHLFLKGLLKQPALLTWLLSKRQSHREAIGLSKRQVRGKENATAEQESQRQQQEEQEQEWLQQAELVAAVTPMGGSGGIDDEDDDESDDDEDDAIDAAATDSDEEDDEMSAALEAAESRQLAVDESRYGLAAILPSRVTAALEATDKRRPRTNRARARWRLAVFDAFVGGATPYVGPAGWKPPLAHDSLTGPRNVAQALVTMFSDLLPASLYGTMRHLPSMCEEAYRLQLKGATAAEAQHLLPYPQLVQEVTRIKVAVQLRHTLLLLGRGVSASEVVSEVLCEKSPTRAPISNSLAQAILSPTDVQDDHPANEKVRRLSRRECSKTAQVQLRHKLLVAVSALVDGSLSPSAGMPWNDDAMANSVHHLAKLPAADIMMLCKVALYGLRRRLGIAAVPESDGEWRCAIVKELLIMSDVAAEAVTRKKKRKDSPAIVALEAAKATLLETLEIRRVGRSIKAGSSFSADIPHPLEVVRFKEALLARHGSPADGSRRLSPSQLEALAERMAASYRRSDGKDDALGAMADRETDPTSLARVRTILRGDPGKQPYNARYAHPAMWYVVPKSGALRPANDPDPADPGDTDSDEDDDQSRRNAAAHQQGLEKEVQKYIKGLEAPAGTVLWDSTSEMGIALIRALQTVNQTYVDAIDYTNAVQQGMGVLRRAGRIDSSITFSRKALSVYRERKRTTLLLQLLYTLSKMVPTIPVSTLRAMDDALAVNADVKERSESKLRQAGYDALAIETRAADKAKAALEIAEPKQLAGIWGLLSALGRVATSKVKDADQTAEATLEAIEALATLRCGNAAIGKIGSDTEGSLIATAVGLEIASRLPDEVVRISIRMAMIALIKCIPGPSQEIPARGTEEEEALLIAFLKPTADFEQYRQQMSTPAGRAKLEQNLDWLLAPVPKRAKKVEKKVGPKAGSKRSTSAKGFGRPKDK